MPIQGRRFVRPTRGAGIGVRNGRGAGTSCRDRRMFRGSTGKCFHMGTYRTTTSREDLTPPEAISRKKYVPAWTRRPAVSRPFHAIS